VRDTPASHEARVLELLESPHPGVRDAAIVTGLHHGSAYAWAKCQTLALSPSAPHPLAMTLLAGLGEPGQHKRLAALVESDSHRAAALRALGFSGNVAIVPLLLNHALSDDKPTTTIAIEALGTMAGAEFDKRFLAGTAVDTAALTDWWQRARARFDPSQRYLGGLPASRVAFAQALTQFPTRRRYLLSLLLSIRTGGATRVQARALTAIQRAQISTIAARGPAEPWACQFSFF
jgi:hypothetical protein